MAEKATTPRPAELENYYKTIIQQGLYSTVPRLRFHLNNLFDQVDFTGKRVLDIGGGNGRYCFYAHCRGAKEAICLEPEDDGSRTGVVETFRKLGKILDADNVSVETVTFQEYNPGEKKFDIILLYDSINHLDEESCIDLLENKTSKDSYMKLFSKLRSIANKGAQLIICDCSRNNFYPLIKLSNPVDPGIEWEKHQTPETWIEMLKKTGFINPIVTWTTFNPFGEIGKLFLANKIASYFLTSHFRLSMKLPK